MAETSSTPDNQTRVIDALREGVPFDRVGPVTCVETHGAVIFLVGDRAYKMKRAISLPYMDFGTLERRHAMCRAEIDVNRRTAPSLYLGVAPVLRTASGAYRVGPIAYDKGSSAVSGEIVEWLVVMRRFADDALLLRMADTGKLDRGIMIALAIEIARFHDRAEVSLKFSGPSDYRQAVAADSTQMLENADVLDREVGRAVAEGMAAMLEPLLPLVERRRAGGAVRRCHGDLHLRNVCMFEGRPTLFDAIEFNDRMATIDILYDLAFLLMDLDHRHQRSHANLVLNNWLWRVADVAAATNLEAIALLPLMLARRAAIRAFVGATALKVASWRDDDAAAVEEARAYQKLALEYLWPVPPRLVAIGGLSGSGKTTLAMSVADDLGRSPGAVVIRTDVERKRAAGIGLDDRMPAGAYTAEASARVYADVLRKTETALRTGHAVIVDGVFAREAERGGIADLGRRLGIPFAGIWLDIHQDEAVQRVQSRGLDASDAGATVVERQFQYDLGAVDWYRIDAASNPIEVAQRARRWLGR